MYTILIPVDNSSERALAQSTFVGSLPLESRSTRVVLLHSWTGRLDTVPSDSAETQTINHVESVRRASDYFSSRDIDLEVLDGSGDPAELILAAAEEIEPDLIVMGGRKRSPARKALFGSVTQSVLLNTDLPVTVTGN